MVELELLLVSRNERQTECGIQVCNMFILILEREEREKFLSYQDLVGNMFMYSYDSDVYN